LDRAGGAAIVRERAAAFGAGARAGRLALSAARDSARTILREIESLAAGGEYVRSYEIGKVHLALGDRGKALDWLERAYEEKSHSRAFLRVDPQLATLRGDARFEKVVKRTMAGSRARTASRLLAPGDIG